MTAIPAWRMQSERGSRMLMRFIVAVGLRLGRPAGRALLYPICAYFLLFSRRARIASRDYLTRVFGRRPTLRERFRHYHCFGSQIYDRVHLLTQPLGPSDCRVDGEEAFAAAVALGRGVLLMGAHIGSFEAMRAAARARGPERLRVLMYEENAQKIAGVLAALEPNARRQVIALGRPQTMLEVRDALQAGDVVGLLADRFVAGDRVRRCRFLGELAPFPEGPFALAAAVGAPVVLFSALQTDGRLYRIRFEPFAERIELPRGARDAALQALCERYAQWLEARCREAPYNWFNFFDFWGVSPAPDGH
jgi:predicted LPLAT superfamily acyltransferase